MPCRDELPQHLLAADRPVHAAFLSQQGELVLVASLPRHRSGGCGCPARLPGDAADRQNVSCDDGHSECGSRGTTRETS